MAGGHETDREFGSYRSLRSCPRGSRPWAVVAWGRTPVPLHQLFLPEARAFVEHRGHRERPLGEVVTTEDLRNRTQQRNPLNRASLDRPSYPATHAGTDDRDHGAAGSELHLARMR